MAMISVKAATPGKVGLWEVHPDHPGGEVFVTDQPVEVSETAAVKTAIKNGRLAIVTPAPKDTADFDATDSAVELAAEMGIDLATVTGSLKNGRIGVEDVRSAADG